MSSGKCDKNMTHWHKYGKRHKSELAKNIRAYIIDIKSKTPCKDCGKIFHPVAMDFDHVRGNKKFQIGSSNLSSWKGVLDEISKCEIVCSNCHRVRTFTRRINNTAPSENQDDQLYLNLD